MQKLTIATLKTTLKTILSTAALLLLSTSIQAKHKTAETSAVKQLS
jgi:hypothetical protein